MTDYREELAAAIAEKYLELDALSKESGAYGAIRLDWARYGEDGLDDMLIAFMEGLDDFDKSISGAMKDEDYVRTSLENIMDERGMTDEQRTSFLKPCRPMPASRAWTACATRWTGIRKTGCARWCR